jgi:uncharacterized protein YjbI with pentapeptide repeats
VSRNRRTITICAVSLALAGLGIDAGAASAQAAPEVQDIDLLFSQSANEGTLKPRGENGGQALTLRGVSATVWFQNRPGRQSGHFDTEGFVDSWSGFGFVDDPPNAALTVLRPGDGRHTAVVKLSHPHYLPATHRVRYRVGTLRDSTGDKGGFPRHFEDASLFIDDTNAFVLNGCVVQAYASCPGAYLTYPASGLILSNLVLNTSNFSGADFSNDTLFNTAFVSANLSGANLSGAKMDGTNLTGADLTGANLADAGIDGSDPEAPAINLSYADLTKADLTGSDLTRANLTSADLTGANLTGATVEFSNFTATNLTNANLTGIGPNPATVRGLLSSQNTICNTTMPGGDISNRDCPAGRSTTERR